MEHGALVRQGTPREIFADPDWLRQKQLGLPKTTAFAERLEKLGFTFQQMPLTAAELADDLMPQLGGGDLG